MISGYAGRTDQPRVDCPILEQPSASREPALPYFGYSDNPAIAGFILDQHLLPSPVALLAWIVRPGVGAAMHRARL